MRVAFAAAEVVPFAKTGGLADVCGALPLALSRRGVKVDVFMPRYRNINRRKFKLKRIDRRLSYVPIAANVNVYFIESAQYFEREGIYGHAHGDYKDNLERFKFFSIEVLESLKRLKKKVRIVHCHDWHTALIPVYLKETYGDDPFFAKTKTLLTIHNLAFQGLFPKSRFKALGLDQKLFSPAVFEFWGKVNLMKAGIVYSDCVSTVSPRYAKEIQTKKFGCGLHKLLRNNARKIKGILNGIDESYWNPATDPLLKKNFTACRFKKAKQINKVYLQKLAKLTVDKKVAVLGFIGRLTHQKGVDLILKSLPELLKLDCQVVIQGLGDGNLEKRLKQFSKAYKGRLSVCSIFDESVAHQIYAGSDIFLMPSIFEPCGLAQMISLRYATVPIVFKTGGLADTITHNNGFVFERYSKKAFIKKVKEALKVFKQKRRWTQLVRNGAKSSFSWNKSVREYKKTYQWLLSG